LAGGTEVHRAGAPLPTGDRVETDVRRDPVEPGAQRGATFEPVERLPGANHRLLHRILGLEGRAEHPVAVARQLTTVELELLDPCGRGNAHPCIVRIGYRTRVRLAAPPSSRGATSRPRPRPRGSQARGRCGCTAWAPPSRPARARAPGRSRPSRR